ncbi:hypothetical protein MMC10_000830 [Thelotrema lepadinum]|nr:hypothetical protein [Thelotrema lepadinum]
MSSQPSQIQPSSPVATSNVIPPHGIVDNTSLASLLRLNGERHVFFQDQSGIIREAVYQQGSWNASTDSVVATNARSNTPLAAFSVPPKTGAIVESLYLYYVSTNNTLSVRLHEGEWATGPAIQINNLLPVIVNPPSKTISAIFSQDYVSSNYSVLILYEKSYGSWSVLSTITNSNTYDVWTDLVLSSASLQSAGIESASIQSPITGCSNVPDTGLLGFQAKAYLTVPKNTQYNLVSIYSAEDPAETNGTDVDFQFSSTKPLPSSFLSSDLTCNYLYSSNFDFTISRASFWIDDAKNLQSLTDTPSTVPAYAFPYQRLTTVTPINSTQVFLYAQFNGSILTEHAYDLSTEIWTSTNVSIVVD